MTHESNTWTEADFRIATDPRVKTRIRMCLYSMEEANRRYASDMRSAERKGFALTAMMRIFWVHDVMDMENVVY